MTKQRYTVQEAAEVLGITVDAVRMRVKRDSVESVKEEGRVYVLLNIDQYNTESKRQVESSELVDALRDQIAMLKTEVEDWKEEARRKDTIIMSMTQRIPELEPAGEEPSEPTSVPMSARAGREEGSERSTTGEDSGGAERSTERVSWWRRWFT